jgi:hypothetical protein
MGILSAVIATVADVSFLPPPAHKKHKSSQHQTSTPVPIYICAALYIFMAAIAAVFPFEPYGRRSS